MYVTMWHCAIEEISFDIAVVIVCKFDAGFFPRGASDARVIAIIVCLSMCVCVCVSHAGIVSKRLNIGSCKQHHVIAQGL